MKKDLTFKMAAIATSAVLLMIAASLPLASATPSTTVSGLWFPHADTILSNVKFVGANFQCDASLTGEFVPGPITANSNLMISPVKRNFLASVEVACAKIFL